MRIATRVLSIVLFISIVAYGQGKGRKVFEDRWSGFDKFQHFSSSFYLTITSYYYLNRFYSVNESRAKHYSVVITLNAGLGKELYDKYCKKTLFSLKDLTADLLGVVFGIVFINNFT